MNNTVVQSFDYTRTAPSIIAETDTWAVVYKPPKMPTAPLRADEMHTAVQWFLQQRPSAGSVCGKKVIEAGLLHRLDTDTRGLVLFAKTQAAYHFFTAVQEQDLLIKTYYAFTEPVSAGGDTPQFLHSNSQVFYPSPPAAALDFPHTAQPRTGTPPLFPDFLRNKAALPYSIRSQFRNFGPKGKKAAAVFPHTRHYSSNKRIYETTIEEVSNFGAYFRLCCRLSRGYRHQVRVHLASLGLPIAGDPLYNIKTPDIKTYPTHRKPQPCDPAQGAATAHAYTLQLYAVCLSFPTPENPQHRIYVELPPPDKMIP